VPWLILAVLALGCRATVPVASDTAPVAAVAIPDHITLSWTGDPSTTETVTWRTGAGATSGLVQYQAGRRAA